MPACSICSRSAKHAHMTVADKGYNFCSQWCMDVGLKQINDFGDPYPYPAAMQDAIDEMKQAYAGADLLSMTPEQAIHFCGESLWNYQRHACMNPSIHFIPTTWEESYIREACLPAVGKLPHITIETAVPAIIKAFENECASEIPW